MSDSSSIHSDENNDGNRTECELSPSIVRKRELTRDRMRRWRKRQSVSTKTRATTEFEKVKAQVEKGKRQTKETTQIHFGPTSETEGTRVC